jgi:hypothetical protein
LPENKNVFGETVQGEGAISDILFGSRVKTSHETALISEIGKVSDDTGKSVTFTDWNTSSSKQLAQFKAKVGSERYQAAAVSYGQELKKQLTIAMATPQYKRMSPEDKLKVINSQDADALKKTFLKYGFVYKAPPTVPASNL